MKKIFDKCLFLVGVLLFIPSVVFANTEKSIFQVGSGSRAVGIGKSVVVSVSIRPDTVGVNAIEGSLVFDPKFVSYNKSYTDNSVIDLWVMRPTMNEEGKIDFAGIVPGGTTKNGIVAEFEFIATELGSTTIASQDVLIGLQKSPGFVVLQNNQAIMVNIQEKGGFGVVQNVGSDQEKPQFYPAEIGRSEAVFENNYFVSFLAKNANEYFVQESHFWEPHSDKWEPVQSPYVLEDQARESYVFIKARDSQGNETIIKVAPVWYKQSYVWLSGAMIASVIILLGGIIAHKRYML
jgi:hypothetical protein